MIPVSEVHHIEVPCDDLGLAESFYSRVFGARVFYRKTRDGSRAPLSRSISELKAEGIEIDATFLDLGSDFRIGFLARAGAQQQREIDHIAMTVSVATLDELRRCIEQTRVEIVRESPYFILARDCFGMQLELYPEPLMSELQRRLRS